MFECIVQNKFFLLFHFFQFAKKKANLGLPLLLLFTFAWLFVFSGENINSRFFWNDFFKNKILLWFKRSRHLYVFQKSMFQIFWEGQVQLFFIYSLQILLFQNFPKSVWLFVYSKCCTFFEYFFVLFFEKENFVYIKFFLW